MEPTRRAVAVAALAAVLALGAAALARPLLLAGTVGLGAWLLARQARFAADVAATTDALAVEQRPSREVVAADESVAVTLSASLDRPAPVAATVEAGLPVAATGPDADDRRLDLARGDRDAETAVTATLPVAGRHAFRPAAVTLRDRAGLFATTVELGETPAVTAEPRTPDEIHVGEGGDQVAAAFGEHATGRQGPGIEPAELRQYVIGDPADSIDWKATARLNEPHVREYEVETDLQTALLVDHRASMGAGRDGRRKLDYARQVALAYLSAMRRSGGAVGLYALGDEGLTVREPPDTTEGHYATLRLRLHDLAPTALQAAAGDAGEPASSARRPTADGGTARPPGEARRMARRLAGDGSAFAGSLRPFLADAGAYVERVADDPLYAAVRSEVARLRGSVVTVVLTDDERRTELREAVERARGGDDRVAVFLLPTVLFEPGGLADLEEAYRRYLDFEEFRRDLAAMDRVTAFEVAPPDRIEALLSTRGARA